MRIANFTGLNTIDNPLDVGLQGLTSIKNLDIDNKGKLSTREGFTKILNKSLVAMSGNLVLCSNNELLRINDDGSIETLASDITGNTLSCVNVAGNTYFTTGNFNGVVTGSSVRNAGLDAPLFQVQTGLGNLPAGDYLIAVTSVAEDGRESGSNPAQKITVGDNASIFISVLLPYGADNANIYASGQNGEELFYQATATNLTITGVDALLNSGEPINREYQTPMPIGRLIEEYSGHLLIADNEFLYFSQPLDYELFDALNNIIPLDSAITMIKSVETGVFISTSSEILFATGETPDKWIIKQVYNSGAFYNSAATISATLIGDGSIGKSVIFTTQKGICIGTQDGIVQNISERKIKLRNHTGDVSAVVNHNRYVVSLNQ